MDQNAPRVHLSPEHRETVSRELRRPGVKADMLIERFLGHPGREHGCRPYTRDVATAMSLLPEGVHFLCGRFEGTERYWCDVGWRPQVQAWGESLACAIAGAAFAYLTHPEAVAQGGERRSSV